MEMVKSMFDNIKYLYKYLYKGTDVALMKLKMNDEVDEVEIFECLKYVNATRAFYNIYSFPIQERFPAVMTLPVHEENKQNFFVFQDPRQIRLKIPQCRHSWLILRNVQMKTPKLPLSSILKCPCITRGRVPRLMDGGCQGSGALDSRLEGFHTEC